MAHGPRAVRPAGFFSLLPVLFSLIFSLVRWWRGWVGPLIFFCFICCKVLAQCYNSISLRKDREMTNCIIQMRHDLAEEGYSVPASRTFSNYDTLDDRLFVTAEELEGATFGEDPADSDDHPFCYVQLRDGRSLYFISIDLDFIYKLKIVEAS
jgi:hypothetical protein